MHTLTPEQLHERANALLLENLDATRKIRELRERQTAIAAEVAQIDERLHALAADR